MIVLVNTHACAGRARQRWSAVAPVLAEHSGPFEILNSEGNVLARVAARYQSGERMFVAAGGDGTVNRLINIVACSLSPAEVRTVFIGAIGLGSSNDFQKPFSSREYLGGYPCRVNTVEARWCDLGILRWTDERGAENETHWINNASIGVTADANDVFNHPPAHLEKLKRVSTESAIVATAVETIATFANITGALSYDAAPHVRCAVTNLGIVKNPNFSGSLCYDSPYRPDNGLLGVHLCEAMTKLQMLRMLYQLSRHRFSGIARTQSLDAATVEFTAGEPFAVEFDGEIIHTRRARFSLRKEAVRICA